GQRAGAIPHRMARILWLLPDTTGAHQPGGMDPPKATSIPLAAMAERPQPLHGTAAPWRAEVQRSGCRRLADRILAHVSTPGGPTGPAQPLFRCPRSPPALCSCPSLTRSNRRGTDPYARWCGRGGIARCPPIPIGQSEHGATLPWRPRPCTTGCHAGLPPRFFCLIIGGRSLSSASESCPDGERGSAVTN